MIVVPYMLASLFKMHTENIKRIKLRILLKKDVRVG